MIVISRRTFLSGLFGFALTQGNGKKGRKMLNSLAKVWGDGSKLTGAWEPHSGGYMANVSGEGLDSETDASISYIAQSGFPTGHALQQTNNGDSVYLETPPSPLVQAIGLTDFLYLTWVWGNDTALWSVSDAVPEDNNSGFDIGVPHIPSPLPSDYSFEIPGSDGQYSSVVNTSGMPITPNTPHMVAAWWTAGDLTARLKIDDGEVFSTVANVGAGPADPASYLQFGFLSLLGSTQHGPAYLWQGTQAVANAVSQLSTLYGSKLAYSDFDNGSSGSGGGIFSIRRPMKR